MTRSAAHIPVAALGFAALVLIASQANAQPATSGSTIQWNDPPGQAPSTGTVSPIPGDAAPSAPPPGATKLPPGTVVPGPDSADTGSSPPGATRLPPGTVVPPPDSANSGIRWNTPQPSAPTSVPGAPVGPAVTWRSGFQGGVIWVEIIDPASFYRVERIDLVAPDGRAFAAHEITRTQARYDYSAESGANVGVGAWGGSHHSGVGVGVGFPAGGRGVERADNATHSLARFQLADPRVYRRTAPNWSVLVRLVDHNGHASVARFPAPRPSRY